jgi:hypothetical protein
LSSGHLSIFATPVTSADASGDKIESYILRTRFYIDPETGVPHIHNHQVSEHEVIDVLDRPGEDRPGSDAARIALGQTGSGRFLRVIYVPEPNGVFVITAYDLTGKPLAAYRRRRRKKHQ